MRLARAKLRCDRGGASLALLGALMITAVVALGGLGIAAALDHPLFHEEESSARGAVGIEQILNERGKYFGEQVTVRGPIDEILGQKAFTIAPPDEDRSSLLVFTDKPLEARKPTFVSEDAAVVVEGRVHYRDSGEIARRMEGLDESKLEVTEDEPVVLASRVRVMDQEEPVPGGPTAEDLTKRSSEFVGRLVTVAGKAERYTGLFPTSRPSNGVARRPAPRR